MPNYYPIVRNLGIWPENYYKTILEQLELGNRLELICGLSGRYSKSIRMHGRDVPHNGIIGEIIQIWLTNDERRRIIREIAEQTRNK